MEMSGLFFMRDFLFTKDKFVVEEEIEDHNNDRVECESASGEDEFIGKW